MEELRGEMGRRHELLQAEEGWIFSISTLLNFATLLSRCSLSTMASPERRQEQLPAEVLGLGLVVREVGVDELLGVGQEEVLGHGGGARGAHGVHQPPVALQLHGAPVVQPAAGRGEPRSWVVVAFIMFYEKWTVDTHDHSCVVTWKVEASSPLTNNHSFW